MSRFPYTFFDNFVVRVPTLPFKEFQEIFSENTNDEKLKEIFSGNLFRESIYLASPELFKAMVKSVNNSILSNNDSNDRLRNTLIKYFNRMSTRCTPFGLFSGIGIGYFGLNNSFPKHFSDWQRLRETKIDMNFMISLSQYLLSIPDIRNKLLFFPNNSIYRIGNRICYIDQEMKGMARDYIISSAPLSKELKKVLLLSEKGKTISQLAALIRNDEISFEEALDYIEELIENNVLKSELEPNVSGEDYLDSLISILNRIDARNESGALIAIKNELSQLDLNFVNAISSYEHIENLIRNLNVKYEQKYLFQTDLYFKNKIELPRHIKKELKRGISFLNRITMSDSQNTLLEKFKAAFYERFGREEISLALALDTEFGIGYRQDVPAKGIHPYIDDLELPSSEAKRNLNITLNSFQIILNQKVQEAYLDNKYSIDLSEEYFSDFRENWNDLPDTLYCIAETVVEKNKEKIYISYGSGNAATLLGRFCSERADINTLIHEICNRQATFAPDKILAEIIHLPEARTGNILRRIQMREFEIPYLGKSLLPEENQITVDDLYLSIVNERLVLRSKLHNKEVIPYLTNAHNYSVNSLPLYHFLCDFNKQGIRPELYFDWGALAMIYNFFPRIEYGNIILSKARWKISSEEARKLLLLIENSVKDVTIYEVEKWRKRRKIPQWVQWIKSDLAIIINFKNLDLVTLFANSIKNEAEILIEEFLSNEGENFSNQFIFPLYKDFN